MTVLGQDPNTRPVSPDGTWQSAKAFWFQVLGYKLYAEEVKAFHESDARTRIMEAPARTSKSYTAAHDAIPYCMPVRPMADALIWTIGPNFRTNKEFDYLYDIFVERRHELSAFGATYEIERAVNRPTSGDMEIRFVKDKDPKTGRSYRTRIMGLSAENEKMLIGEQVSVAIQSEAAKHPHDIYPKYLVQRCGKIILPTTPSQEGAWLKKLGDDGAGDSSLEIERFHFPPNANPTYNWRIYDTERRMAEIRAKVDLGPTATASDDPYFAEQFEGRWVYYTGRVLPFQRRRHIVYPDAFGNHPRPFDRLAELRIGVSIDYGYEDGAVALFWAIAPGPLYLAFDELYERRLTSERFVDGILSRLSSHRLTAEFFCADPKKPEVDRIMRDLGLPVFVMDKNAQASRHAGYRRLIDTLTQGPFAGFPGLYLSSRCEKTADEWDQLHYREGFRNEYSETSVVGADHATDAARYFLMTRPTPQPLAADTEHPVDRFLRMRRGEKSRSASNFFHHQIGARRYAA